MILLVLILPTKNSAHAWNRNNFWPASTGKMSQVRSV